MYYYVKYFCEFFYEPKCFQKPRLCFSCELFQNDKKSWYINTVLQRVFCHAMSCTTSY